MENYNYSFASFWQRFFARLIDAFIIGLVASFIAYIILSNKQYRELDDFRYLSQGFGAIIFCLIYYPILESMGGTIGKRLVGIETINLNSHKSPSIINSYGRSILYLLFVILLFFPAILSCLAVLWTKNKQTWHDMASNIIVIEK